MRTNPLSPRPLGRALAVAVVLAAAGLGGVADGAAETQPLRASDAGPMPPVSPDLPGLPHLAPSLRDVPVGSAELDAAAASYRDADAALGAARARRLDVDRTRTARRAEAQALEASLVAAQAREASLTTRLAPLERAIQALAVERFIAGGDEARINTALASENPVIAEIERKDLYSGLSMQVLLSERAAYMAQIEVAQQRAADVRAELDATRAEMAAAEAAREPAVNAEMEAGTAVSSRRVAYEDARVLATVDGAEFPLVALDAYVRAAEAAGDVAPGCNVQWWGLAGISRVEGRHGTYGGASLEADGDTTDRIIGIRLDGTRATAVAGDSDGGSLDGDTAFDRAVGPMQLIPETWRRVQADGNEDGVASPFNLYDASLAAARYLCGVSHGLDADTGLRTAYFAYNHSLLYVDTVLRFARLYEDSVAVPTAAG